MCASSSLLFVFSKSFAQMLCRSIIRLVLDRRYLQKPDMDIKNLPFLIKRTHQGNLPIYVEKLKQPDRTFKQFTTVGNFYGDTAAFAESVKTHVNPKCIISFKERKAVIEGAIDHKLKMWLTSLGF